MSNLRKILAMLSGIFFVFEGEVAILLKNMDSLYVFVPINDRTSLSPTFSIDLTMRAVSIDADREGNLYVDGDGAIHAYARFSM